MCVCVCVCVSVDVCLLMCVLRSAITVLQPFPSLLSPILVVRVAKFVVRKSWVVTGSVSSKYSPPTHKACHCHYCYVYGGGNTSVPHLSFCYTSHPLQYTTLQRCMQSNLYPSHTHNSIIPWLGHVLCTNPS